MDGDGEFAKIEDGEDVFPKVWIYSAASFRVMVFSRSS